MTKSGLNYQDFELVNITDKELVNFTRLQNAAAWKGHLSADDYTVRETVLGKSKIASSDVNRLLVFLLKEIDNPEKKICSCELMVRKAWKFRWNDSTKKVEKKEVLSGCVGGVFTYHDYRGKGFAKIMIDKLVELCKEKFLGEDGFTFLYSEVGDYYRRNGFHYLGVELVNIPLALNTEGGFESIVDQHDHVIEPVKYHDFKDLFEEYNTYVDQNMKDDVSRDHKTRISVIPTSDYVDWFHLRSKYFASKYFHSSEIDFESSSYEELVKYFEDLEPHVFGLKITDKSGKQIGFIAWTYDWSKNENAYSYVATILKIFIKPEYQNSYSKLDFIELMKAHVVDKNEPINKHSKPIKIVLWESEVSKDIIESLIQKHGAKAGLENGSASAILMNNESENNELVNNNILWEGNDKLPWF